MVLNVGGVATSACNYGGAVYENISGLRLYSVAFLLNGACDSSFGPYVFVDLGSGNYTAVPCTSGVTLGATDTGYIAKFFGPQQLGISPYTPVAGIYIVCFPGVGQGENVFLDGFTVNGHGLNKALRDTQLVCPSVIDSYVGCGSSPTPQK